ncbi:MAG: conjugal transfer protein TraD [Alphaproteobacteria bacterium]|nr:conjugal transfer protein TraD [Alphaproteobacteria bacterium]MBU1825970.1 conjugal transfer protein TraD [Alphaproteobacteria bacterium]
MRCERRRGAKAALRSFAGAAPVLAKALAATRAAHRRSVQARNRLQAKRARHDTRAWQVKRRERTRQLIELGGLIAKADLIELTGDDRAVILGLLVEAAATLRGEGREQQLTLWRRRGRRAFGSSLSADATSN